MGIKRSRAIEICEDCKDCIKKDQRYIVQVHNQNPFGFCIAPLKNPSKFPSEVEGVCESYRLCIRMVRVGKL